MVASPDPVSDLGLEEQRETPLGGFPGDLGLNNWSLEYSNTQTYMRAGPSYDYPTRSAIRSHSHNRTAVSVSSIPSHSLYVARSPRGSPFNIHRDLAVSDGRSFSLPPSVPEYPPPAADPQYNYSNYHFDTPSAPPETGPYPPSGSQWLTRTSSPQSSASTSLECETASGSLCQTRVGSDRIRAISRSRRTNPDKKLFHCSVPGCGATLTSNHNFKSRCLVLSFICQIFDNSTSFLQVIVTPT